MATSWLDHLRRSPLPGLTGRELSVLRAVAELSNWRTGISHARQETIAATAACSPGHTRRLLARLAALGWLTIERPNRQHGNTYRIDVERVETSVGRLIPADPERAPMRGQDESRARIHATLSAHPRDPERAPTRAPSRVTTNVTTNVSLAADGRQQLVLALLDLDPERETDLSKINPYERQVAEQVAAGLPADTTPEMVRCARRRWVELGRDPVNATPGALARDWRRLTAGPPARHRARPSIDCVTCDGIGLVEHPDGARPCPACHESTRVTTP